MIVRLLTCSMLLACASLRGQWVDHYPHVEGYRHHIYLEGYELPTVADGPLDPAPSPDGKSLFFSAKGWIWKLDLASGRATRITSGGPCDARPVVSPDGRRLAFVRDDTRSTWIVLKDLETGQERDLVRSGKLDLDPAFTGDGKALFYASSEGGGIDLWRVELDTGARKRLTTDPGLEVRPQPAADGKAVLFMSKVPSGEDRLLWRDLEGGATQVLQSGPIFSMTRAALARDGHSIALALPLADSDLYQLYAIDVRDTGRHLQVLTPPGRPLNPAWSPDGWWVYFSEEDARHQFALKRASVAGRRVEDVPVKSWDWGVPTTTLTIRALQGNAPVTARYEVVDGHGHPLFPPGTPTHFDNQNGRTYFHGGEFTFTVPVGSVRVTACHGPATPPAVKNVQASKGVPATVELALLPLDDFRARGWHSGDLHFHLNYGGPHSLVPEDLLTIMRGEDLDLAEPMAANLRTRLTGVDLLGWKKTDAPPLVEFGQEVRSNFLGHLGLAHIGGTYEPWFWGPDYPLTRDWHALNADALRFSRRTGAFSSYVHPTAFADPFDPANRNAIPLSFIPDALAGLVDGFEISGLWVHELGASEIWYRLLDVGCPVLPLGATDSFPNFYRCSVTGSNRTYVNLEGPCTLDAYFAALRKGRVFVSSGPLLDFRVEGQLPGSVVQGNTASWSVDLASVQPLEHLELLVNGQVVHTLQPMQKGGRASFAGQIKLPEGGWIAFRAWDDRSAWPGMNSRTFAHSAPHWIGRVGSVDPARAKASARLLLSHLGGTLPALEKNLGPEAGARARQQVEEAKARLAPLAK